MTPLIAQPAFQLYALCSAFLILILYALGFYTAKVRADRKKVLNFEDVRINGGAVVVEVEHPDVQRVQRAHRNALENAVPFFAIGFLYTQTSPSMAMLQGLFVVFISVRLLHAIFYLGARQPFRTVSFAVGGLVNVIMAVQVIRAVL